MLARPFFVLFLLLFPAWLGAACGEIPYKASTPFHKNLAIGLRQNPGIEIVEDGGSITAIQPPSSTTQSREFSRNSNDKIFMKRCTRYSGPIVALSAQVNDPGEITLNPYVYATHYGTLQGSAPYNQYQEYLWFQIGVIRRLDVTLIGLYSTNHKLGRTHSGVGDTTLRLGFKLLDEQECGSRPDMRLVVQETFPTGKYDGLDEHGLGIDAHGQGAYQTAAVWILSKRLYAIQNHPIRMILNLAAEISSSVPVHGFHAYGGGSGTHGKVFPGASFGADLSCEYSFTQAFAAVGELVATSQMKTTFSGRRGVLLHGLPASNSPQANYVESMALGLEYSPTDLFSMFVGSWFSVKEHHQRSFVTGVLSLVWDF